MNWILVFVTIIGSELVILHDLPKHEYKTEAECQRALERVIKVNPFEPPIMPICIEK